MKRSPLSPGRKSLDRGSTFATRATPLRRKSRKTPKGRPTDEQIEQARGAECWLAQFATTPCSGIVRLCHLLPKERLRFYNVPESEIWNPAIVRPGCDGHHADLDDNGAIEIPRLAIPAETEDFAAEWSLTWLLDRIYGPIEDVQTAPEVQWR